MVEPGKQPQLYQPNTGRNVAELHSNFEPQSAQPRFSSPESRPNLDSRFSRVRRECTAFFQSDLLLFGHYSIHLRLTIIRRRSF